MKVRKSIPPMCSFVWTNIYLNTQLSLMIIIIIVIYFQISTKKLQTQIEWSHDPSFSKFVNILRYFHFIYNLFIVTFTLICYFQLNCITLINSASFCYCYFPFFILLFVFCFVFHYFSWNLSFISNWLNPLNINCHERLFTIQGLLQTLHT